jgi:hypothetical protein
MVYKKECGNLSANGIDQKANQTSLINQKERKPRYDCANVCHARNRVMSPSAHEFAILPERNKAS